MHACTHAHKHTRKAGTQARRQAGTRAHVRHTHGTHAHTARHMLNCRQPRTEDRYAHTRRHTRTQAGTQAATHAYRQASSDDDNYTMASGMRSARTPRK